MSKRGFVILLLCAAFLAGGYFFFTLKHETSAPNAAAPRTPPPPAVGIMIIKPHEVELPSEYAGRVEAYRNVEIRAQVGGLLKSRDFNEGSKVNEGQTLFHIDPATYDIALKRAQAQLEQAQANLQQAEENFARIDELASRDVASKQQREQALAQRDQNRATVALAQAEIQAAKLNITYTTITAPVTGISALQSPPVGTLILAQQTLLTTIQQIDPAYVSFFFTVEEERSFRGLNQRRATPIKESDLKVELRFGDGTVYKQTGRIDTAARRVDAQTGTIEARVIFPNPDDELLPGQFVRVFVRGVTVPDGIVIPAKAVSQGPQGPSVFVVGANDIAEARLIKIQRELPSGLLIEDGLKSGDRIVVDGVIRVRPNAPVRPVPDAASSAGDGQQQAGQTAQLPSRRPAGGASPAKAGQ
jgi:membrane fusion protein (multidrug efflux system)